MRNSRMSFRIRRPAGNNILWAVMFCLILAADALAMSKEKSTELGNSLYHKGYYEDAVTQYQEALSRDAESPLMNYNLGTAFYKTGDYSKAVNHLQKALLSEDGTLRQRAYYNLGNAAFQSGLQQEETNINQAVTALEDAVSFFDSAMKMDDKDKDAQYNYGIAVKELERLRKKQQEEQKKQEQQKEQSGKQCRNPASSSEEQNERQKSEAEDQQGQQGSEDGHPEENKPQQSPGGREQPQQPKDQQKPQGEDSEPAAEDDGSQQQNASAGGGARNPQEKTSPGQAKRSYEYFTLPESEMLLDEYQRQEEPQGFLNFMKQRGREIPVERDW